MRAAVGCALSRRLNSSQAGVSSHMLLPGCHSCPPAPRPWTSSPQRPLAGGSHGPGGEQGFLCEALAYTTQPPALSQARQELLVFLLTGKSKAQGGSVHGLRSHSKPGRAGRWGLLLVPTGFPEGGAVSRAPLPPTASPHPKPLAGLDPDRWLDHGAFVPGTKGPHAGGQTAERLG